MPDGDRPQGRAPDPKREAIAERPDGSRVPFIPYPTPLRDAKGNVVGGINMLGDVSERKQAELQQRKAPSKNCLTFRGFA